MAAEEARTAGEVTGRELEGLRNQEAELRRLMEDLVAANSAAVAKIQALRTERADLLARLGAAEALEGRESAEMGVLRGRMEEAEGKVSALEAELAASQQSLAARTIAAEVLRTSGESSGRVAELEDALKQSAAALRAQRGEIEGLEAQLIIAQEETEEAMARLKEARDELLASTRRAAEAEHAARLAALALSQMNEAYVQLSDDRQQQVQEAERAVGEATEAERVRWEAEAEAQSGRVAVLEAALETMRRQVAGAREEADTKDSEVRLFLFCSMKKQYTRGLGDTAVHLWPKRYACGVCFTTFRLPISSGM